VIWGVPFVLAGQYFIWGRFVHAAWKKKRIHYAVTNRRVIVVQSGPTRNVASAYLDTLPTLIKETGSKGIGMLRFSEAPSMASRRNAWSSWDGFSIGSIPVFVDVEDVDFVYRLVSDLREKTRKPKAANV
jgi:hypothetical protein